ncbi:hypothetical protein [Sphingobacterium hungaricum]
MKNLQNQTKQAFLFSLGFYALALLLIALRVSFAPIMFSIALLVSMIWVILVIREVLLSPRLQQTEKMLIVFFVILLNIFAGIAYFYLIRKSVVSNNQKR